MDEGWGNLLVSPGLAGTKDFVGGWEKQNRKKWSKYMILNSLHSWHWCSFLGMQRQIK